MKKYEILQANSVEDLKFLINDNLNQIDSFIGSVFAIDDNEKFCQAVIINIPSDDIDENHDLNSGR